MLAVRTMATSPVESFVDTLARRCDELKAMVEIDDPMAFARTTTRAVKTIARGSGNDLLVELLTDLANQTVWETIWKTPLDYQTRDIRRLSADLMASTLKAIRQRKPNAAVTHLGQLLESDRDRALSTLSPIRGETFDLTALSHGAGYGGFRRSKTSCERASSLTRTRQCVTLDRVLHHFQRRSLDRLAGRLSRKFHRLLGERIDAAACFGRWLVDDGHLNESGNDEFAGFIQLLVSDGRQMVDDRLDVILRDLAGL
jgi:hypothetical protein